ncbi:hypothetical protein BS47DRAFT_705071 [Hydnum rufescens UP504]|uniref:Uncharacterized protein n=1 Tax=Hydnum rufescens UP504 TaxID=1448309 RepID=A0A9P6B4F3_9AGAM|nr:hypothetical protein BS47DRAFT_705071 [Hydnum rufescens UP504]
MKGGQVSNRCMEGNPQTTPTTFRINRETWKAWVDAESWAGRKQGEREFSGRCSRTVSLNFRVTCDYPQDLFFGLGEKYTHRRLHCGKNETTPHKERGTYASQHWPPFILWTVWRMPIVATTVGKWEYLNSTYCGRGLFCSSTSTSLQMRGSFSADN